MKKPQKKHQKNQARHNSTDSKKTVLEHLQEIRRRLFWVGCCLFLFSVIGFFIRQRTVQFLLLPSPQPLMYSSPTGGLDFSIKISLFFGFIWTIPVAIFHILSFLYPIFPKKIGIGFIRIFLVSLLLLCIGILFGYTVSLPATFSFLQLFKNEFIQPLIHTNEYLSFVFFYLAGFGLIFQLPLVVFLVHLIHPLSTKMLLRKEKYVILASFIFAAIMTPTPDVLNQTMMALPILFLYQISIFAIHMYSIRKKTFDKGEKNTVL